LVELVNQTFQFDHRRSLDVLTNYH